MCIKKYVFQQSADHMERSVHWMMVRNDWIIGGPVIGTKEGPSTSITLVLFTAMEDITMKEESISSLQFNVEQRKHLHINTKKLSA